MKCTRLIARILSLCLVLGLAISLTGAPARAQQKPDVGPDKQRFLGQVTALIGTGGNPAGFQLQLGTMTWDIKVAPKAVFTARSAEADVEGLLSGDYAVVNARRVKHVWYAYRVDFDVQPVAPLRTFSGTVVRASVDGKRFSVRIEPNKIMAVRVAAETRYRIDGRFIDFAQTVSRGEYVQVLARRNDPVWIAYDLNVRSLPYIGLRNHS
jgi:hypothetical protein